VVWAAPAPPSELKEGGGGGPKSMAKFDFATNSELAF